MKRLLVTTAIVGLAVLPGLAIAQTDQSDDPLMQEESQTEGQTGTDGGAETGTDTGGSADGGAGTGGVGETGAGTENGESMTSEGYSEVDPSVVEASEVEGAPVMSRDGEDIADVSQVLVTEDGEIEAIVVNVGGFLGMGTKNVELPFDEVSLQSNDESGDVSVVIPMTKEELEDMPAAQEG